MLDGAAECVMSGSEQQLLVRTDEALERQVEYTIEVVPKRAAML
jgi:hypothetical protein